MVSNKTLIKSDPAANRKYIIYTPLYEENTGGVIVLHKLCSMLREQGGDASIWLLQKPHISEFRTLRGWIKLLRWCLAVQPKSFLNHIDLTSPYRLPIAKRKDIAEAIIVYPEMVSGNPLNASHVVRWFLNKPGALTGRIEYGVDELYFYYHIHFNDEELNLHVEHHLNVIEFMGDVYRHVNKERRSGSCYMVRKGEGRALDQHAEGAIQIDGMSHQQIADIFNQCEYFISYDLYTMYSRYAAMCGCIPIVVPEEGLTKEAWRPDIENRFGIAYGWDDVTWATETRDDLIRVLAEADVRSRKSVTKFIETSQGFFKEK